MRRGVGVAFVAWLLGAGVAWGAPQITHGPIAGGVTDTQAKIFVRALDPGLVPPGEVEVVVRLLQPNETQCNSGIVREERRTPSASADYTAIVTFTRLTPDSGYYHEAQLAPGGAPTCTGQFRTMPSSTVNADFNLVIVSDVGNQGKGEPYGMGAVFTRIRDHERPPLVDTRLIVVAGDWNHENPGQDDPGSQTEFRRVRRCLYYNGFSTDSECRRSLPPYNEPHGSADFVQMAQKAPIAWIWDDHDAGENDADCQSMFWPHAINTYGEYIPSYIQVDLQTRSLKQSVRIGALAEVFFVDGRTQRKKVPKQMLNGTGCGDDVHTWLRRMG